MKKLILTLLLFAFAFIAFEKADASPPKSPPCADIVYCTGDVQDMPSMAYLVQFYKAGEISEAKFIERVGDQALIFEARKEAIKEVEQSSMDVLIKPLICVRNLFDFKTTLANINGALYTQLGYSLAY